MTAPEPLMIISWSYCRKLSCHRCKNVIALDLEPLHGRDVNAVGGKAT